MDISYNTYLQIPVWQIALVFSNSRKTGRYVCNKTDIKKSRFFTVNIAPLRITLKIPFKAVLKHNSKIGKKIYGFNFSTATHCKSLKKGLCQIKCPSDCYAIQGEERNKSYINKDGSFKMNSLFNGYLTEYFVFLLKGDNQLLRRFCNFLRETADIVRINVNGDFNSQSDCDLLAVITMYCHNVQFYGYTARDDLEHYYTCQDSNVFTNYSLNGSNRHYTNQFKVTYELREYWRALQTGRNCQGDCFNCGHCFTFIGKTIVNLFHKKDADIILNTLSNRHFMAELLQSKGFAINIEDMQKYKGLFYSINKWFIDTHQIDFKTINVKNLKDLLIYFFYDGD